MKLPSSKRIRAWVALLLRGCIPTKALLHSADVYEEVKHGADHGVATTGCRSRRQGHARENKVVQVNSKVRRVPDAQDKITVFNGFGGSTGRASSPSRRQGRNARHPGQEHHHLRPARKFARSQASRSTASEIVTPTRSSSSGAPQVPDRPRAGAVGVEFASIFHRFGVECTLVEAASRVLPIEDEEISKELEKALKKQASRFTRTQR